VNRALVCCIVACAAGARASPLRSPQAGPVRSVDGTVTVAGSTKPVVGATVYSDRGELATTDLDGYFTIELSPDEIELVVTADRYASRTVRITDDLIHVELEPLGSAEVIEIHAKAPEQTHALAYQLTPQEVSELPGAGNDILRATQVLPGVARIPYSFGGLVLRGTSPTDSAVYLDGVEVPIAFHFGGITSFFPSDMLASLQITPGNFDAEYGRAQGGLVALATREPRTDRWREGGSIGLLDSGAFVEGPVAGGGIMAGVRYSFFNLVATPFAAANLPLPSYWDAQVRGSWGDPTALGRISPEVFLSVDDIANNEQAYQGQFIAIDSMFVRVAVPYVKTWSALTLHVVPWFGTDSLSFSDNDDPAGSIESFVRPVYLGGLRADLTRDYSWGHLRGGLDSEGGYLTASSMGFTGQGIGPPQTPEQNTMTWVDVAGWVEGRIAFADDRLSVKPGLRVEYYGGTSETVVDPRLNIQEQLTSELALRAAVGRFHQPPTPADLDPINGNPGLQSSYYDQASLGIDGTFGTTTASITGFYDYGTDLGVIEPTATNQYTPNFGGLGPTFQLLLERELGFSYYRQNVGRGRSDGIEALVRRKVGRWFGLLAYTLSQSQRTDDPRLTLAGPYPYLWRPFELDQRHNFNAAGSVALGAWRLGARVQVVSGNPYSPSTVNAQGIVQQIPFAATLPTFFQLDVRADRLWHRCWGDIDLYFDIQNITDRINVEDYSFDASIGPHGAETVTPGLPIIPFIGVGFVPK
jgi:hypothetical protein